MKRDVSERSPLLERDADSPGSVGGRPTRVLVSVAVLAAVVLVVSVRVSVTVKRSEEKEGATPVVDVFLRTYIKDLEYTEFNLRSFKKYRGILRQLIICCPTSDGPVFSNLVEKLRGEIDLQDVKVVTTDSGDRGLPYFYDMAMTDKYTDAQFVLNADSDFMFIKPVTEQDLFRDGKAMMHTRRFADLPEEVRRGNLPTLQMWGFPNPELCTIRRPQIYPIETYGWLREHFAAISGGKTLEEGLPGMPKFDGYDPFGAVLLMHPGSVVVVDYSDADSRNFEQSHGVTHIFHPFDDNHPQQVADAAMRKCILDADLSALNLCGLNTLFDC